LKGTDTRAASRYYRMADIIGDKKVFLLTATPINNSLIDLQRLIELFRKLCAAGAKLVRLHLLEAVDAPADWNLKTDGASLFQNTTVAAGFPKKELFEIDETGKGKVYINKTTYFDGIPEPVWNFHIGGYQV